MYETRRRQAPGNGRPRTRADRLAGDKGCRETVWDDAKGRRIESDVLNRLLHEPGMHLVMGNHDAWFAFGVPSPLPPWMGKGELAHQRWVRAQLDPALRPVVAQWPWAIEEEIEGVPVAFVHYALDETGRGFADPVPEPVYPGNHRTGPLR